jgi:glycosyltransferase involved in cell wall biosynthesis
LRAGWLTRWKRVVAADAAAMTVVSSAMRDEALRVGLNPPRLEILPMGADMHGRFTPVETTATANDLLFVGRLVAKKGLPFLLDAMPAVLRERPAVTLTIAGFGPDEEALKAQAVRLGIERSIRFLGAVTQDRLPDLYRKASLFVAPFVRDASGDQEGLPVVLMEAIASGCPVLAGNVSGVCDLLGEEADDVCVVPSDIDALSAAILGNLANPQAARRRALRLRESILGRFDWTVVAAGYADLIQQYLPTSPQHGSTSPGPAR